jgi:type II secretory pathway component GspD/PulD (secretin)
MDVNGGVLSARLRTLLDKGDAQIVTRPIVLALNNTLTMLQVGSKVPFQDVNPTTGYPIISEGTVGVSMEVKPSILDLVTQSVELDITKVEVSTLSNFMTTQNVNRPVFNTSNTRTKVTLKSGETYQLSSMKGRRSKTVREGIPVLMHIPILGHLFSSRSEVMQNVDVLFFVTPHIVPPGQNVLLPFDFQHGTDLVQEGVSFNEPKK